MATLELTENTHRYYLTSGRIPPLGTAIMLGVGLVSAAALAVPLTLLVKALESAIIGFFAPLAYGAGVGFAVQLAARLSHVRNPKFAHFIGLVVGLFAVYISWIVYIWILSDFLFPVTALVGEPGIVFGIMQNLAAVGPWSVFGWQPTGWQLYGVWLLEALFVVLCCTALAANASLTYCEDCRRWTKKLRWTLKLPTADWNVVRLELEGENYEVLHELAKIPYDESDRLDVVVSSCPTCENANFLTLSHVTIVQGGDGPETKTEAVVQNLIVPHDLIEPLEQASLIPREAEVADGEPAADAEGKPAAAAEG